MFRDWRGINKVFRFTVSQQVKTKSFRVSTILLALICFVLPAMIMTLIEVFSKTTEEVPEEELHHLCNVYVVNQTGEEMFKLGMLFGTGDEWMNAISYSIVDYSPEEAVEAASQNANNMVLLVNRDESGYLFDILLPDNSELTYTDAGYFAEYLGRFFPLVLADNAGMTTYQMLQMYEMSTSQTGEDMEEDVAEDIAKEDEDEDGVRSVLDMLLPFVNIMVLYFLVLLYGQSVANQVITEKTSKLMDLFLVSIRPKAMIFGKVFAVVTVSFLQFLIWIGALVGGFAAGTAVVRMINPQTQMTLILMFGQLNVIYGMFSVPGIFLALLMVLAGFLLYCSLAAIGGAIAGKPEDLSSCNLLFTMALIISFFATLYAGGIKEIGITSGSAAWINWVPFTSILVTPSRILMGEVTLIEGIGSLAIVLVCAGVILLAAGRIYQMMSLFKGDRPSFAKVVRMLKDQ